MSDELELEPAVLAISDWLVHQGLWRADVADAARRLLRAPGSGRRADLARLSQRADAAPAGARRRLLVAPRAGRAERALHLPGAAERGLSGQPVRVHVRAGPAEPARAARRRRADRVPPARQAPRRGRDRLSGARAELRSRWRARWRDRHGRVLGHGSAGRLHQPRPRAPHPAAAAPRARRAGRLGHEIAVNLLDTYVGPERGAASSPARSAAASSTSSRR